MVQEQLEAELLHTYGIQTSPSNFIRSKHEDKWAARYRIHKSKTPLLLYKSKINSVKVGNISETAEADWVVETNETQDRIRHTLSTGKPLIN